MTEKSAKPLGKAQISVLDGRLAPLKHTLLSLGAMLCKHGSDEWNYGTFAISSRLQRPEV